MIDVRKTGGIAAIALLLTHAPIGVARADQTSDFLKGLAGDFSGRGTARILGNTDERIACKITNAYNDGTSTLSLSGECASTKGKNPISGAVVSSGGKLSGSFVAPSLNTKVTQSSGAVSGGKMVLSVSLYNEKMGDLTRVRQEITRSGNGFKVVFQTYDNATRSYSTSGTIDFRKR